MSPLGKGAELQAREQAQQLDNSPDHERKHLHMTAAGNSNQTLYPAMNWRLLLDPKLYTMPAPGPASGEKRGQRPVVTG